jgi:hypothetical protein
MAALAVAAAGASPLPPPWQGAGTGQEQAVRGTGVPASALAARGGHWERVLERLDRRRARAFATGDPALLAAVYQPGSAVLAADRATLAAYAARGLTVEGATFRLLDVRSRRLAPGEMALRVVDRLAPVTARTNAGAKVRLPHDRPTVHRLVLRRGADGWRIAAVAARSG